MRHDGDLIITTETDPRTLAAITEVGGYLYAYEGARVSLPKLRHQGDPAALRRALARRRLTLDDGILCRVSRARCCRCWTHLTGRT